MSRERRERGLRRGRAECRRALAPLRELWWDLLALLWPTECVGCGAPDRDCCRACRQEVRASRGKSQRVIVAAGVEAVVAGSYRGALRAMLVGYKHDGRVGFARELGARLRAPLDAALRDAALNCDRVEGVGGTEKARAACAGGAPGILIVTVPSRPARVRERGYRHVDELVRIALRGGGGTPRAPDVPPRLLSRALRTSAGRTTQVGLGAVERQANAARIRVARPRQLRGRDVILVDDVITTGATVTAAATALSDAGARVVAIVALCAVERRSRSPARRGGTEAEQGSTLRERRDGALQGPPA